MVKHGGLKRQGSISAVVHSPRPPEVMTLIKIAAAIEAAERKVYAKTPAPIPLWEFFVSDEQAALLRADDAHRASLVKPPEPSAEQKAFEQFQQWQEWQRSTAAAEHSAAPKIVKGKRKA